MSISSEISRLTQAKADIKTAIENKGVTVPSSAKLDDYPDYIDDIEQSGGGGGGETVKKSDVNFIDYDGAILYSYTTEEFLAFTEMPENPTHEGLISQGWNWTLTDAKEQVNEVGACDIGQMYVTESGDTEIDVSFVDPARLSPVLAIAVNGTVEVDWGDDTAVDTVSGTSLSKSKKVPHTYLIPKNYTIKIHVTNGKFAFHGSSSITLLEKNNTTGNDAIVYSNRVRAIRIGNNFGGVGSYAFQSLYCLETITLPSNTPYIWEYAFSKCYSLKSITIPPSIQKLSSNLFDACNFLRTVSIPLSVTQVYSNVFLNCYSLENVVFPFNITKIGTSCFQYCYTMKSVKLPPNVSSVEENLFYFCKSIRSVKMPTNATTIGGYVFQNCYSLESITLPQNITSIGGYVFSGCYSLSSMVIPSKVKTIGSSAFSSCAGLKEIHFLPTTPPTLSSTNAFSNISSDCVFYVPAESLDAYKTANNWSTYASRMAGE